MRAGAAIGSAGREDLSQTPVPHGAAAGVPPREREALLRKLSWLTLFRLVTITVLLGGTAFAVWSAPGVMGAAAADLFRLVLATYVVSLAFAMALHRRVALTALAYAHVALDVVIATCVAAMTGGAESVFAFMFLLAIVNGSILLFRKGAIAATAFALAGYVVAAVATPQQPPAATVFAHTIAFITTSALASYLSEQLRRTGERLEAREVDLAAITALHESIVQSVASGMVTIDATGRITFLNRAGELITGLRLRDVQLQPADRWFGVLHGSGERDETDFVNARGERLRVGYTVFPLVARGGGEIGQAIIFQDLTRLREMEAQVQRSERLADLGQLAAGLAHELRNPLASMVGSIELLRQAQTLPPSDARLMDIVLREAARLEQLVAAFLAFSRPATPRRERVALERAIGETLDVFAHDPAASRVRVTRALEPASAWCDPDQLRQVLWNLLSNAAQAAASGERAGEVRVACRAEGKAAAILVEDDGPGIPPQDVARIFTPFFTTKERGTGLGLAIVQRVVDAHGGGLTVEPLSDRGTRFTVRLPCSAPDPGA